MAHLATGSIVPQIESLFDGGSVAGLTDRELLERFTRGRDAGSELAFTALVARHGPLVLGLCRQVLGDRHDAEDAFQAVFLVLACKARSIRNPDLVGSWLHRIALRTARRAKSRLNRQRKNEEGDAVNGQVMVATAETPACQPEISEMAREQAEILHGEVARLPRSFRLPVILCYFEGHAIDAAARRLRWPVGTFRSRLARAREKLRRGLRRRGVALPTTALAAALNPRSSSASVSSHLCQITTRTAMSFASGQASEGPVSSVARALAKEVEGSMLLGNAKVTALGLLLFGALVTGAGLLKSSLAMTGETEGPAVEQPTAPKKPDGPSPRPAPGRMFISGRVLDPERKPVPDATTMVYARSKGPRLSDVRGQIVPTPLGQGQGDRRGQFRLDAPRTSSSRHDLFGVVALAPGFGIGWAELDPDAEEPTAEVLLRPEQIIQGRLVDSTGRPAGGVRVTVRSIGSTVDGREEGPHLWMSPSTDSLAWPRSTQTGADGRFTVRGVGRNLHAILTVIDPRFARLRIPVDTDDAPHPKQVTMALEPARIITGRVTYAETGKPTPHATITILASRPEGGEEDKFEADADGRFRANPVRANYYFLGFAAPQGQPYLHISRQLSWTRGSLEHSIDAALPRGVEVRGKITEEGSGKPIAGALVAYVSRPVIDKKSGASNVPTVTAPDGSFLCAALPGPGYLVVQAPGDDYVLQEIGRRMVQQGRPGGERRYANAFVAGELKPDNTSLEVNAKLRRGMTVAGQILGPHRKPVQKATMISRLIFDSNPTIYRAWSADYNGAVRSGRFALHGLGPDTEVPVSFLEPGSKLGATVNLSGKSATGGPITVRLEPCGTARARLVDPGSKPVAGYREPYLIMMVVTPGPSRFSDKDDESRLAADEGTPAEIDPTNYHEGPVSDVQGRIVFPALIPGATYRIIDRTTVRDEVAPRVRKEFTVKAGEALDLGDIRIEHPRFVLYAPTKNQQQRGSPPRPGSSPHARP